MSNAASTLSRTAMMEWLKGYFAACNSGDVERIAVFFEPDAVHYFPGNLFGGPCHGPLEIGKKTQMAVEQFGSFWTIDALVCDPETGLASTEWTLENRKLNALLRGSEWYQFSKAGRLQEVRAYLATPPDRTQPRNELGGFDYVGRGYAPKPADV